MLAELHGKISSSGSEDNLTGNVFGALRYVSFNQVVKPLFLSSISSQEAKESISKINLDFWADNIKFWPYDNDGELDVLLKFDDVVIGIEVKYNSGMSDQESEISDDEDTVLSKKQLDRESRIIKRIAGNRDQYLILLARKQFAKDTVKKTLEDGNIENGVKLCFIGWEDFLEALKAVRKNQENPFTQLILDDLIDLLTLKGFEYFKSFNNVKDDVVNFENGYYEFPVNFTFCYDDEVLKENFYEYANGD